MEDFFNKLMEYLLTQSDHYLYAFLFVSSVVENLFPPVPGDTITAFGAFLVGTGRLNYMLVFLSTTAGSIAGFMLLYFAAYILEKEFFMKKNYKAFSAEKIEKAEEWFRKYGSFVILLNRFMPGVRSVISVVSGLARLNPMKVFIFSAISASVWNFLWMQAGFFLGNSWDSVKKNVSGVMSTYNLAAGIILAVVVAVFIIIKIKNKRTSEN